MKVIVIKTVIVVEQSIMEQSLEECDQVQQIPLTRREQEVTKLLAQGYTNRQIAKILCISIRTVETHRSNTMQKLHLNDRAELVRYVQEVGLLET